MKPTPKEIKLPLFDYASAWRLAIGIDDYIELPDDRSPDFRTSDFTISVCLPRSKNEADT